MSLRVFSLPIPRLFTLLNVVLISEVTRFVMMS